MLYMDLTINNITVFQGQACLGQVSLRNDLYVNLPGVLMFIDTQGWSDPTYDGLGTRYQLIYFGTNETLVIPLQAVPIQNLAVVLGGNNCVFGLYEQNLTTAVPAGAALPAGADTSYINQSLLSPQQGYVVSGYWLGYSV